jgi:hypothetical protein
VGEWMDGMNGIIALNTKHLLRTSTEAFSIHPEESMLSLATMDDDVWK